MSRQFPTNLPMSATGLALGLALLGASHDAEPTSASPTTASMLRSAGTGSRAGAARKAAS
jgi:hypothetical protein